MRAMHWWLQRTSPGCRRAGVVVLVRRYAISVACSLAVACAGDRGEVVAAQPAGDVFLYYDVLNTRKLVPAEFRMVIERQLNIKLTDTDLRELVQ